MDKHAESQNQTRIELSLAALMFFSPLVQKTIKTNNIKLSQNDTNFIKGYIRLGYISLIILAITILTGIINYRVEIGIITRLYTISIILLIIILVIGAMGILTNTNILAGGQELLTLYNEQINTDKKEIILCYLPIYNIYKRYQNHNFDEPNFLLKESILVWGIFIILGLLTTQWRTSLFLIIIIIRVASLMGGIDVISPKFKKIINTIFLKNPEEIRGYIRGSISSLRKSATKKQAIKESLNKEIQSTKDDFSLLYNIEGQNSFIIKTQYIIGLAISILIISQTNWNLLERSKIIPLLILLGRYIVMLFKRHHLPPLPIFKELTDLGIYIYAKAKSHFNI